MRKAAENTRLRKNPQERRVYQLKISLRYSRPPIWRRVLVTDDTTMAKLHQIVQIVMGWDDYHLHQFEVRHEYYSDPEQMEDDVFENEDKDEHQATLGKLFRSPKAKFLYRYDFGDNWEHEILIEKIMPPDGQTRYPVLIGGARACPPEDSGGIGGYYEKLEIMRNPRHTEYEEIVEWMGKEFDPESFDADWINRRLRALQR
ncbi:MAG TPA: plasmid pRiA4b ORF-3 family protein [Terriglobia bacterium]|nr:plasmid pRiA4b ORF-3 family protein [Terriglobia bacterium]